MTLPRRSPIVDSIAEADLRLRLAAQRLFLDLADSLGSEGTVMAGARLNLIGKELHPLIERGAVALLAGLIDKKRLEHFKDPMNPPPQKAMFLGELNGILIGIRQYGAQVPLMELANYYCELVNEFNDLHWKNQESQPK